MVIFSERWVKTFSERLAQAVRTGEDFFEWLPKPFERMETFSERVPKLPKWMTLAVRTANKWLVNGIPFQTGTHLLTFSRERLQVVMSIGLEKVDLVTFYFIVQNSKLKRSLVT